MDIKSAKSYLQSEFNRAKLPNKDGYLKFHRNSLLGDALYMLLTAPTMPEEPTDEMLLAMRIAWMGESFCYREGIDSKEFRRNRDIYLEVYKALRAMLTAPPKPETKKVWCFTYKSVTTGRAVIEQRDDREMCEYVRRNAINNPELHSYISPVYEVEVPNTKG